MNKIKSPKNQVNSPELHILKVMGLNMNLGYLTSGSWSLCFKDEVAYIFLQSPLFIYFFWTFIQQGPSKTWLIDVCGRWLSSVNTKYLPCSGRSFAKVQTCISRILVETQNMLFREMGYIHRGKGKQRNSTNITEHCR